MSIAFFELEGWEKEHILKNFDLGTVHLFSDKLTPDNLPERRDFEVISVFVDSRITPEVIEAFPNLKLITTRSTGYDHLDVSAARSRGVEVAYVPGYGDNTVAEFTFGLLLSLTRKIHDSISRVKEQGKFTTSGLRGVDIKGKTIGVIGTGRIGREAISIAQGFGLSVIAYDAFPDLKLAGEKNFRYVTLDDLLASSDFITIHCPLLDSTRHLLNKENMTKIKSGAYLVNTARGPIIETAALLEALRSGRLAGAGLDVLEEEGDTKDESNLLTGDHPNPESLKVVLANDLLIKMPNVLVTPHNAFNTEEALVRILTTTIQNISHFLSGQPENLVPKS